MTRQRPIVRGSASRPLRALSMALLLMAGVTSLVGAWRLGLDCAVGDVAYQPRSTARVESAVQALPAATATIHGASVADTPVTVLAHAWPGVRTPIPVRLHFRPDVRRQLARTQPLRRFLHSASHDDPEPG